MGARDDFGRLKVADEELAPHYRGCLIAASMSVETIARLLGCDRWEADLFRANAQGDLLRIRHWAGTA